jgi:hypothetical protein
VPHLNSGRPQKAQLPGPLAPPTGDRDRPPLAPPALPYRVRQRPATLGRRAPGRISGRLRFPRAHAARIPNVAFRPMYGRSRTETGPRLTPDIRY